MARAPAGAGRRHPQGPRRRQPVLLHRRRRHQHDAQQRPLPDQSEAARRAPRHAPATSSAGCSSETADVAGITLYMQPVQDLTIDATVSRTQYQFVLEDANPDELADLGRRSWSTGCEQLPRARGRRQRSAARTASSAYVSIDRDTAGALRHHAGDRSTTRSTTPSASASSRRSSPSRTSTASSSKPIPTLQQSLELARARSICRPRPRRTARCRCRRSPRSSEQTAPLQINHLGQFPATTVSFNLAPGASLGAAVDAIKQAEQEIGLPASIDHQLPGRGARLPVGARQRAAADPRRDRHGLHRAGRALRELHPPGHDPLDAALGRRRRAAWR